MKLTDRQIKSLKPKDKRYEVPDGNGLGVRITPKGEKTFQYRFRFDDKQQRISYGNYPEISLSKARKLHQADHEKLANGINPAFEKQAEKQTRKSTPTVADLVTEYFDIYLSRNLKRPEHPYKLLQSNIVPILGNRKVSDIKRRDLILALSPMLERGANVNANRTLSAIKGMFRFAVERGIIDASPASEVRKQAVGGKEKARERTLTFEEIQIFMEKVEQAPFDRVTQLVLKLLLSTGQRVGEVTGAEWSEIDFEKAIWIIPAVKTKTATTHKVPLSDLAITYLQELKALSAGSKYIAQSPVFKEDKPILYSAIGRAVKRQLEFFGLGQWTPHDLRRTFSTRMNNIYKLPHVIEKILNHKMPAMMAVYDHSEMLEDRIQAMDIWANKLKGIMEGAESNIIHLQEYR